MTTKPANPTNKQHAAFPTLFNRNGEARRIKGFRASREMFSRAIRLAKVLDLSPRLAVLTPVGMLILSEEATALIKEEGGVESLILNGFEFIPAKQHDLNAVIDEFMVNNKIGLKQADMFEDEPSDDEHLGKGSR